MNGRKVYWPRGRTLGGSSAINGLIVIRGQREDYDEWAAAGNAGLALRGRAAVVSQARAQRSRRERIPRRRRAAVGVGHRRAASARRGDDRRCRRARHPAQRRFQRRHAGRRRLLPAHDAPRQALLDGGRVPAAGAHAARICASKRTRMRRASCSRIGARPASTYRAGGRRAHGFRAARSDPRAQARCNRRSCSSSRASGRRRCLQPLGIPVQHALDRRRRKSAGPPAGARHLPLHATDHDQRRAAHLARQTEDRTRLPADAKRPDGGRHQPGRHLRAGDAGRDATRRAVPFRDAVVRHGRLAGARRSRASRCRCASCGRRRAARCASGRPIRSSRRRCSRTTCRRRKTVRR